VSSGIEQVSIAAMTQDEAEAIADWSYQPPYDFYNWRADDNGGSVPFVEMERSA
jgi:hypothetical protein